MNLNHARKAPLRLFAPLIVTALGASLLAARPAEHTQPQQAQSQQTGPQSDYSAKNPGNIAQSLPPKQSNGATYSVDAYPLYRPVLAPGAGRETVDSYCNTCHSTRYITMQPPLPAATWEAEVDKMIKTFGMTNPEGVAPQIKKYLAEHYTPETRKR